MTNVSLWYILTNHCENDNKGETRWRSSTNDPKWFSCPTQSWKRLSNELKVYIRLSSQIFISTQIKGVGMNRFFSLETLKHPPALSKYGQMYSGNKSDLINCIEEIPNNSSTIPASKVSAAVLEGSALVKWIKPKKNQIFQSYTLDEFESQVANHQREYSPQRQAWQMSVFDTY